MWDESCFLHAVLCDEKSLKYENGRVNYADPWIQSQHELPQTQNRPRGAGPGARMSFSSVLKKIIGIEHAIAPIANIFVPGFAQVDAIVSRVTNAVITIEQNDPRDGQGAIKAQAVMADFAAGLEVAQAVSHARGKLLVYDADALKLAIDSQVAMLNAMAKVKASFHEIDLPAAPAGAGQ